jgi:hypothetical protein
MIGRNTPLQREEADFIRKLPGNWLRVLQIGLNSCSIGGNLIQSKLYARDKHSGTYDTFVELMMAGQQLCEGANRTDRAELLTPSDTQVRYPTSIISRMIHHPKLDQLLSS